MNYKLIFMASLLTLGACTESRQTSSGIDYANLDTTIVPGDDFYAYATGHWIDHNPQNPEYPRWGSFTKLDDTNKKQVQALFLALTDGSQKLDADAQKIADLYTMAMDSVRRNELGASPLKPYLKEIDECETREQLIALCHKNHDNLMFHIGISTDDKNAEMNIVYIYQGGLTLDDERYYLEDTPDNKRILAAHHEYVTSLLTLSGYSAEEAEEMYKKTFDVEKEMAKVTVSHVDLRDPQKNYHKLTIDELNTTLGYDFGAYIKGYGYDGVKDVNLCQIEPVKKGCELLQNLPLETLKAIYTIRTIMGASSSLSDDYYDAAHKFACAIQGQTEKRARWKRAIAMVDGVMGEIVSKLYVEKYFPAAAKERMTQLVENLRVSLGERIDAQTWMSDATKKVAREKLDAITVKIGYPDKWEDYSKLVIDTKKSLLDNMVAASEFLFQLDREKKLNKPVDKSEWHMFAHTVNAYYNPPTNEICFPAAILQPPFFSMDADDATNMGAIGVVIGHEMTHGFDDQGGQYDKNGNLCQWWAESDIEAYKHPSDSLVAYFNGLEILPAKGEQPALMANGKLCLGENIADHGGVMIAYNALENILAKTPLPDENGFTPRQRFFLSYANVWAGIISEELMRYLTMVDPHSLSKLRVNGTLPHIDAWYEAFDVKEGDALYLPKDQRVKIW